MAGGGDYWKRRDLQAVTDFTDPNALFDFERWLDQQSIVNESTDTVFELSWDGKNVHGQLNFTGPTQTVSWEDHRRIKVYIRRQQGSGGAGEKFVQVWGAEQ